jgi:GAF domain-containing protein
MNIQDKDTPREVERLGAVQAFAHLRRQKSPAFAHISRIATEHFRVPMAFVSIVDEREQWFAGSQGLTLTCTSRADAFCAHTIQSDEMMVVEDALLDPRFRDNPLVTGGPCIRFYAGAPLVLGDGLRLGSVCIADRVPRILDTGQRIVLRNLADIALSELRLMELRRAA